MAPSRCVTALIALVLPIGLAACGSADDATTQGTTATAQDTASPEPTKEESASPEPTTETPTSEEAAESALGDWCAALESVAGGIQAVIPDQGEWSTPRVAGSETPGPDDTFTERGTCGMGRGETFEGVAIGITESQYPDEASAAEWMAFVRDDSDPLFTSEEVDLGDEAIYGTYNGEMAMPPFISYSVTLREGDRVIRPSLRDYNVEAPADEATRRAQVLGLVELLQRAAP